MFKVNSETVLGTLKPPYIHSFVVTQLSAVMSIFIAFQAAPRHSFNDPLSGLVRLPIRI